MRATLAVAPKGNAGVIYQSFSEAFQVNLELSVRLLLALWKKCGELKLSPRCGTGCYLCRYLKREQEDLQKYLPIAQLSRVRKVVEKAVDRAVRAEYIFHALQCGFWRGLSVETALVR